MLITLALLLTICVGLIAGFIFGTVMAADYHKRFCPCFRANLEGAKLAVESEEKETNEPIQIENQ